MLTRDAILQVVDLKTVDIDVPEWGGGVRLRMLTGAERNALHADASPGGKFDTTAFAAGLIVRCIIGEDGGRLFSDDETQLLAQKSSAAFTRVFEAAARLNGLHSESAGAAEKNSPAAPSGASSSASPSPSDALSASS